MDFTAIIEFIKTFLSGQVSAHPIIAMILGVLGTLVVIGQIIVPLTPTKADDEAWDKIKAVPILGSLLDWLTKFAFIQKKP